MSSEARYTLAKPSEEDEKTRLDLQHRIWTLHHNNNLYGAPISPRKIHKAIDLCCGNGVWSKALASTCPHAQVLGADIHAPPTADAPKNCHLVHGDVETDWPFARDYRDADLVFGRMLCNSIRDWERFFARIFLHLRPGGWVEMDDVAHAFFSADPGVGEGDSAMMRWWNRVFKAISRKNGVDLNSTYKNGYRMRDAGFVNVRERICRWGFGNGAEQTERDGEIGHMWVRDMYHVVPGVTKNAIGNGALGDMSAQEAQELAGDAQQDIAENSVKRGYYMEFFTQFGQKPLKDFGNTSQT